MLDLDAPSLIPDSGKRHSISPDSDAKARALAVETGAKWKCARVNAWVDATDCIARYVVAKDARPAHSPCLECSSIAAHVRKMNPQPLEMTMPVAAKKLESVHKPANPFAGWTKYDRDARYRMGRDSYLKITSGQCLFFSALAVNEHALMDFTSVDVFLAPGKIGLAFRADDSGAFRVTVKKGSKSHGVSISARGLIKEKQLERFIRKKFSLVEHAKGLLEVDLEGWQWTA